MSQGHDKGSKESKGQEKGQEICRLFSEGVEMMERVVRGDKAGSDHWPLRSSGFHASGS